MTCFLASEGALPPSPCQQFKCLSHLPQPSAIPGVIGPCHWPQFRRWYPCPIFARPLLLRDLGACCARCGHQAGICQCNNFLTPNTLDCSNFLPHFQIQLAPCMFFSGFKDWQRKVLQIFLFWQLWLGPQRRSYRPVPVTLNCCRCSTSMLRGS